MQMLTNKVGKVSTPPLVEATEEGPERASMPQTDFHHDIITTGDIESVGYGWMTTRAVDLPMSRQVGTQAKGGLGADKADKTNKADKAKWVSDCHPKYMFEDKSLKAWMRSRQRTTIYGRHSWSTRPCARPWPWSTAAGTAGMPTVPRPCHI